MLTKEQISDFLGEVEHDYMQIANKRRTDDGSKRRNYNPREKRLLRLAKIATFIGSHFEVRDDGKIKLAFSIDDIMAKKSIKIDINTATSDVRDVLIGLRRKAGVPIYYDPNGYLPRIYHSPYI